MKTTKTSGVGRTSRVTRTADKRDPKVHLPAMLLEGDALPSPDGVSPELPESYGTERLFLSVRDPHWLYANWDFAPEQQRLHNKESVDGHLILRIHTDQSRGKPVSEIHVYPESKHWFVNVERAGVRYVAEIGFYGEGRRWHKLAVSESALAPADSPSDDFTFRMATISITKTLKKFVLPAVTSVRPLKSLEEAIEKIRVPQWTSEQEQALNEIIASGQAGGLGMSSEEVAELIRGRPDQQILSVSSTEFNQPR